MYRWAFLRPNQYLSNEFHEFHEFSEFLKTIFRSNWAAWLRCIHPIFASSVYSPVFVRRHHFNFSVNNRKMCRECIFFVRCVHRHSVVAMIPNAPSANRRCPCDSSRCASTAIDSPILISCSMLNTRPLHRRVCHIFSFLSHPLFTFTYFQFQSVDSVLNSFTRVVHSLLWV